MPMLMMSNCRKIEKALGVSADAIKQYSYEATISL